MENEKMLEEDSKDMCWEEFKERYLSKIEQLAELFDLDVSRKRDLEIRFGSDLNKRENYEEWMFIDNVMTCIRDCEESDERIRLFEKLHEIDGVREIFDEIYRIWTFTKHDYCSSKAQTYNRRKLRRPQRRSEPGQGDIVDILSLYDCYEGPCLTYFLGEDYAETEHPIVIKIKHNSRMTGEEIAEALHFAARSYESNFTKRIMKDTEYLEGEAQPYDGFRIGLYNANRSVYRDLDLDLCDGDTAMKLVGWLDPEVSLDTGIGEMLKRGWPELYGKVLEGKMTPFEALLKTGYVHPEDLFDILGNSKEIQTLVEEKFPPYEWIHRKQNENEQVDESDEELLQHLEEL